MDLEYIKTEVCPVCGAGVKAEKREHQHCNGEWNEYRTFTCGLTRHFSPNYSKEFTEGECKHDPEVLERDDRRAIGKDKVLTYIGKLKDVDDDYKQRLKRALEYT